MRDRIEDLGASTGCRRATLPSVGLGGATKMEVRCSSWNHLEGAVASPRLAEDED